MRFQNIRITTASPLENLTRLDHYFSDSTTGHSRFYPSRDYFSDGITRQCDLSCIIQYSMYGTGETWVKHKRYAVPARHAFINILNRVDTGYCYPQNGDEEWGFIAFSFLGGNVRSLFYELIERYGPVYDLSASHDLLISIADSIERRGEMIYSAAESSSISSRLISALLASIESRTNSDNLINHIHQIIAQRVREPDSIYFGVEKIAEELGMSREHLSRVYHKVVGDTLKKRIDLKRIEYIYELLTKQGCSCTEVARLIGIEHSSNLTTYVKRLTGMTPKQLSEYDSLPMNLLQ